MIPSAAAGRKPLPPRTLGSVLHGSCCGGHQNSCWFQFWKPLALVLVGEDGCLVIARVDLACVAHASSERVRQVEQ